MMNRESRRQKHKASGQVKARGVAEKSASEQPFMAVQP